MNYEEFKNEIVDRISDYLPEKYEQADIHFVQVAKNNDKILDGLNIFTEDTNIVPTIYVNDFFEQYENGREFNDILKELADIQLNNEKERVDVTNLIEWDGVKDRVTARLHNIEGNTEYLASLTHTKFEDLAVTYHVKIDEEPGCVTSMPINNSLFKGYGVSVEELHKQAMDNILKENDIVFKPMREVLIESLLEDIPETMSEEEGRKIVEEFIPNDGSGAYVLSNEKKNNGTICILNEEVQDMISEKFGGDFYAIPSSIHEWLILPKDMFESYKEVDSMISDINQSHVAPEERLSDHVFEYDSETREFIRSDRAEQRKLENSKKQDIKNERPSVKEKLEANKLEIQKEKNENVISNTKKKESVLA